MIRLVEDMKHNERSTNLTAAAAASAEGAEDEEKGKPTSLLVRAPDGTAGYIIYLGK